ncbi:DNA-binding transcriptional regulator [Enterobacter sp. CGMCC 5087]|uniref:helix-turn-helix domain-containing protein n=1 Tax=Enterobacter sp. CGMCC 5087 TaxID=2183878 RepID=UPI001C62EF65|nr:helix-turn-helix transcriptional regulator [Enterobacter sp. CGMCC 5087]
MTGFELRIWRRGMGWDQERAAEELGVSVRSYKRYEKSPEVAKLVELAAFALSSGYARALDAAIQRGIADADAGRTKPAKVVFDRLAEKYTVNEPTDNSH